MNIFADYYGDMTVPEDKREEFTNRMLTIFREGGMLQDETVQIFGKKISLLFLPELDKEGRTWFNHNYYEDGIWDNAEYNAKTTKFDSVLIGRQQFNRAISAAYLLYEFYTDSFGLAVINERPFDARSHIGWLNYLFGEQYSNARMRDPWKIYMAMPPELRDELQLINVVTSDPNITPSLSGTMKYLCHSVDDIDKYLSTEDMETPQEADKSGISASSFILVLRDAVHLIKESDENTEEEKLAILKQIVAAEPPKKREVDSRDMYQKTAFCAALLPAEILLIFMSKEFNLDFWKLLEEMTPTMVGSEDIWDERQPPCPPVPPIPTTEFLCCSDDDRAYLWTPNGDVQFSEEMLQWMESLRQELEEIMAGDAPLIASTNFVRVLVDTLYEVDETYWYVYGFRDMFYDFISHSESREVQAAVILLQRLVERHREKWKESSKGVKYWAYA